MAEIRELHSRLDRFITGQKDQTAVVVHPNFKAHAMSTEAIVDGSKDAAGAMAWAERSKAKLV